MLFRAVAIRLHTRGARSVAFGRFVRYCAFTRSLGRGRKLPESDRQRPKPLRLLGRSIAR
eukprot:7994903-Alexandrium_andersonii.AAC.1